MKVSVQTMAGLQRRMEVQVPAERIDSEVEARLNTLGRTAKLQGFRPGKVPVAVIRQRFGSQVHQEVVEEMIKRSFAEAVLEQKLAPAGGPRIEPMSALAGQDLKYTAVFEVYPQIKLSGLDSLHVDRPKVEVTDADVDAMLETLRKQQPNWKAVERAAQQGDRVTVDFEGRIDGVAFDGGKGEEVPIVIGGGRMLADLEQGLLGVKAGDEKIVKVQFPAEYHAPAVAGKASEFTVKVKHVEEPELPPLDDEFGKAYGIQEGGLAELRRQIAQNMRREVEQDVDSSMRNQVLEGLLAGNTVELPKALVDAQISDMQVDWARRAGVYDVAKVPPRENFEPVARRRVTLGLLIGEIVRSQNMEAAPDKVEERLRAVVVAAHNSHAHHHDDERQHEQHLHEMMQAYRRDRQAMSQVESMVLEEQAVSWLLGQAKITDRPQGFMEFTRFGEKRD